MNNIKKLGRPTQNDNKPEKLINAAKNLFITQDYDKVSIRAIAAEADVDSALIRYYFQSKIGLFTAMMQTMTAPITAQLDSLYQSIDHDSASKLLTTYYRVMSQHPDFPKLVFKIASMPQTAKSKTLNNILQNVLNPNKMKLFKLMHQKGLLQEGVDPTCMEVSFFSLMIFPFLMPTFLKDALQVDITPEFMAQLALQNSQLLKLGLINH